MSCSRFVSSDASAPRRADAAPGRDDERAQAGPVQGEARAAQRGDRLDHRPQADRFRQHPAGSRVGHVPHERRAQLEPGEDQHPDIGMTFEQAPGAENPVRLVGLDVHHCHVRTCLSRRARALRPRRTPCPHSDNSPVAWMASARASAKTGWPSTTITFSGIDPTTSPHGRPPAAWVASYAIPRSGRKKSAAHVTQVAPGASAAAALREHLHFVCSNATSAATAPAGNQPGRRRTG